MDLIPVNDPRLLADTHNALVERWHVRGGDGDTDWQILLEALAERILDLLNNNPNKLMTSLYVLDISERVHKEAMAAHTMEQRALNLARAVLDRETRKIATRRQYAAPSRLSELEDKLR